MYGVDRLFLVAALDHLFLPVEYPFCWTSHRVPQRDGTISYSSGAKSPGAAVSRYLLLYQDIAAATTTTLILAVGFVISFLFCFGSLVACMHSIRDLVSGIFLLV